MRRLFINLLGNERGAVAPTVALALVGLIAAGGIAFDYARVASMDTELQDAADQAALAAASQLDGKTGACARAAAAASALLNNETLFANESGSVRAIEVDNEDECDATGNIRFYQSYDQAADSPGADADADANAKVVAVVVNPRRANFALTPIVAAFSSGDISAEAIASIGSAICKMPPLMMCNPSEPASNTNEDFPFNPDSLKGIGIRLVGDGSYEPGNFGFLETGFGNGANDLLQAVGYNSPPGECASTTGVDTKTGLNAAVFDGFNTRFDIDANGNSCPGGNVNCSPSVNVRKDLVRGTACGITGQGWVENNANNTNFDTMRYRPTSAAAYPTTKTPEIMGHPRDLCHAWSAAGNCTGGRLGTGDWDINAYWRSNYGANYAGEVSVATYGSQPKGYPTRYQVYQWETDAYATRLTSKAGQAGKTAYSRPVQSMCLATPTSPYGIVPGGNLVDRRRISIAVLNCKALGINGHEEDQAVLKWADVFLVEPSYSRSKCAGGPTCNTKYTDKTDLYVEMIGETNPGGAGATAGQVVRRDVPYLIK